MLEERYILLLLFVYVGGEVLWSARMTHGYRVNENFYC